MALRHKAFQPCTRQLAQSLIPVWRSFYQDVQPPEILLLHPRSQNALQVNEARQLAKTYTGKDCQAFPLGSNRRVSQQAATYFGSGAVQDVRMMLDAQQYQKIVVNTELSGVQLRNLQAAWGIPVLDRIGLIIEIFAQRARTKEAKLQVEMASLSYKNSRLVRSLDSKTGARKGFGLDNATEVVSARQRGRSSSSAGGLGGGGGAGETELQLQKRRIGVKIKSLKQKLQQVRKQREMHRDRRKKVGTPVIGVVGYTSAGKSTLVSNLSRTHLESRDRLFETLDPVLRQIYLPSGRHALASDTVGFISDLPHTLVSSFKATLEEVVEADLLLHVLDASSPNVGVQREAVYKVLQQLGIAGDRLKTKLVEVWNKSDLIEPSESLKLDGPVESASDPSDRMVERNVDLRERNVDQQEAANGGEDNSSSNRSRMGQLQAQDNNVANPSTTNPTAVEPCKIALDRRKAGRDTAQAAQQDTVWELIKSLRRAQKLPEPEAVVVSSLTGQGLKTLLKEIDLRIGFLPGCEGTHMPSRQLGSVEKLKDSGLVDHL